MESQSFSVLPLWNYMQVSVTTVSLFSLGVLSGNRRFQNIYSLLFWRLLHSKLALLQTQTERWTEIQPLSNILKCKWKELLYIKSWFKPMYSCCWKYTSCLKHNTWFGFPGERRLIVPRMSMVPLGLWGTGDPLKITIYGFWLTLQCN